MMEQTSTGDALTANKKTMKDKLTIFNEKENGRIKIASSRKFLQKYKKIPGTRNDREGYTWLDEAFYEYIKFAAKVEDVELVDHYQEESAILSLNPKVLDYQKEAIQKAYDKNKWMLSFDTGLGKTFSSIEILRLKNYSKIFIVCPANVKSTWVDEIKKWWDPDLNIQSVYSTKEAKNVTTDNAIIVCSYELAKNFVDTKFEAIIIDECHYIAQYKSGRSKTIRRICHYNQDSTIIGLSATPVCNEPKDLWHQLETIWPGRFGTYWYFCGRYAHIIEDEYGVRIEGLNKDNENELKIRLDACSTRVTKDRVAHLLPPFTAQTVRIRPQKSKVLKQILQAEDFEAQLEEAANHKADTILQYTCQALDQASHVCLITHLKSTVDELFNHILSHGRLKHTYTRAITGDLLEKKRKEIIDDVANAESGILITTMHCIKEGLNSLKKFTRPMFCELYERPATVVQAAGRFNRLGMRSNVHMLFFVIEGTEEERKANTLQAKMEDVNSIIKPSSTEKSLEESLKVDNQSEEEFLKALNEATESLEDDLY